MLTHLSVRNYTLVDELDLEFADGMTAITGETGAGKSILLDALSLTLGDRADYSRIRSGQSKAAVTAVFDLQNNEDATAWFVEQEMEPEEQCILRRSIQESGKSNAWINGQPVTLNQLRDLAECLISIHSQHEHQSLTKPAYQRQLLDRFADHGPMLEKTHHTYQAWILACEKLEQLRRELEKSREKRELLTMQAAEFEQLALQEGEFAALEAEQTELANAESILQSLALLNDLVAENDEFNLTNALQRASDLAERMPLQSESVNEFRDLLRTATIQIEEAATLCRREADRIDLNPKRLADVEVRLGDIFQTARKYRVQPQELHGLYQQVTRELEQIDNPDIALAAARATAQERESDYLAIASELSKSRKENSRQLCELVNSHFADLSMQGAAIEYRLTQDDAHRYEHGIDQVELLVRTNPGQEFGHMARIASGGELSRISLAIQVVTAREGSTPCLIFDEVDVGIGGATAHQVGKLLRQLGARAQIICITHLAQVASKAHQQFRVSKKTLSDSANSEIDRLDDVERVEEIARMLGGAQVSEKSRANARELLENTDA